MEPSGGGCSSGAELEADAAIVSAAKLQSLWFWGRGGFCYVKVVDINLTDFIFSGCTSVILICLQVLTIPHPVTPY